jgi:hypothetical protein
VIDAGKIFAACAPTIFVAVPSATPGLKLNERVTDGSCPEWFTLNGPALWLISATALSGTSDPLFERTYRRLSADRSRWNCGKSSITTQYTLFGV